MPKTTKGSLVTTVDQTPKPSETEKLTINLGLVDLGQIDLLVQERFYTNRSDLIRTAIRNQLASHSEVIKQTITRKSLVLGLQHYSRQDLEAARDAGQKLRIQALGLISIAQDVTPKLALSAIESITVLGALQASAAVKAALADRIH
jgi:Arc/MetJ-type ribon-helix-helix transcriptional regulator